MKPGSRRGYTGVRVFWGLFACGLASAEAPQAPDAPQAPREVVTIRPSAEVMTRQGLPQFVGISADTVGATGISMNRIVIPPHGAAKPHRHHAYETAIYLLQGRVETCYGEGLATCVVNETGDFIFIPPDVPHQPRNLSAIEPAIALVARNDPREQENVIPYPPLAQPVPDHAPTPQ